MSKLRCIVSLLTTKNYVVITDTISDGHVEPYAADAFSDLIGPVYANLIELTRLIAVSGKD